LVGASSGESLHFCMQARDNIRLKMIKKMHLVGSFFAQFFDRKASVKFFHLKKKLVIKDLFDRVSLEVNPCREVIL
jgi:hypothetical protein